MPTEARLFGFRKIRKLFTACTGPVGPVPRELLKQQDPTWRIVDERNAIGLQVRSQGRLLWREAEGPSRAHQAQGPREAEAPGPSCFGGGAWEDFRCLKARLWDLCGVLWMV